MYVEWFDRTEREWQLSKLSPIKFLLGVMWGVICLKKNDTTLYEYDFFYVPRKQIDFV